MLEQEAGRQLVSKLAEHGIALRDLVPTFAGLCNSAPAARERCLAVSRTICTASAGFNRLALSQGPHREGESNSKLETEAAFAAVTKQLGPLGCAVNDLVALVEAALASGALHLEAAEAAADIVLREVAAAALAVQTATNYVKGLAARMLLAAACLELFVEVVKFELKTNLRRRTLAFYGHAEDFRPQSDEELLRRILPYAGADLQSHGGEVLGRIYEQKLRTELNALAGQEFGNLGHITDAMRIRVAAQLPANLDKVYQQLDATVKGCRGGAAEGRNEWAKVLAQIKNGGPIMVRYCLDELLGPQSHTETSAMRDLGIALANLSNEASGPELLSLRALSQAVLGKDVWLALDQAHQLLVKGVQRPLVEEALRLAFLHMVEDQLLPIAKTLAGLVDGSGLLTAESSVAFAEFVAQLSKLGDVVNTKLQADYELAEYAVHKGTPLTSYLKTRHDQAVWKERMRSQNFDRFQGGERRAQERAAAAAAAAAAQEEMQKLQLAETGEAGGVLGPAPSVEDLQAYLMAMHQEADDFLQLVRNGDGTVQSRLLMLANPGGAFMQSTPRCAGRSRD